MEPWGIPFLVVLPGFPVGVGVALGQVGEFGVMDISKRGIVSFSLDGEILPTVPFPAGFFGGVLHRTDDGSVSQQQIVEDGAASDVLVRSADADTIRIVHADRPETRRIRRAIPPMPASERLAVVGPDVMVWSPLRLRRPGTPSRSVPSRYRRCGPFGPHPLAEPEPGSEESKPKTRRQHATRLLEVLAERLVLIPTHGAVEERNMRLLEGWICGPGAGR